MIPLPITVPGAAPLPEEDDTSPETSIYLETMFRALEEENGMAVETDTKKNAMALRHRFYRARQAEIARGNRSLDPITISIKPTISGYELHLTKLPFRIRPL